MENKKNNVTEVILTRIRPLYEQTKDRECEVNPCGSFQDFSVLF